MARRVASHDALEHPAAFDAAQIRAIDVELDRLGLLAHPSPEATD